MTFRATRLASLSALVAALACQTGGERPAGPRLVVLIAVDQLRADYIERFRDLYTGGLQWLLENGAEFSEAAFRHSATITGAGHATVATGLHPSSHGIVGNSWNEVGRGRVYCVEDDLYEIVGGPGGGVSPLSLQADTLGDRLKAELPGSKVYSFSTKDRSAVLLGGRRADGAFWYEPDCGCMVSSTYYGESRPDWIEAFNATRPVAAYEGTEWSRLLEEEAEYESRARADRFPTEHNGEDTVFPHPIPSEGAASAVVATPFSDEIVLGAALAALRSGGIGTDADTDLLALGLSATDSVGHRYGPFSQEAMDNHLRLDRALGRLFEELDRVVGLDHVVFALTADHGAIPLVEHLLANEIAAERFDDDALWSGASEAIEGCGAGPRADTVAQLGGTRMYWDEAVLKARGIDRREASECVAEWLRAKPGVEAVFTADQLAAAGGAGVAALFENSYFEGRSAHVQVHLREYLYPGGPRGTGHGSAHGYDRRVPVVLAGHSIRPGKYPEPAGPEDIAPTLGSILGLSLPLEPDTRILQEALR